MLANVSARRALLAARLPRQAARGIQNMEPSATIVCKDVDEALADVHSGATVMIGGFGLCGIPEKLIAGLQARADSVRDLRVVSTNAGTADFGLGLLMQTGQIDTLVASYVGENTLFQEQFARGEISVNFTPQGTLAEKLRAAAAGVPAFFTPAGFGTMVQEGGLPVRMDPATGEPAEVSAPKVVQEFDGHPYCLEEALPGDFALVKAKRADTNGNLQFYSTANNFNEDMGGCARVTIAEVEELVPAGAIAPEDVHLSGVFVDRVVQCNDYENRVERLVIDMGGGRLSSDGAFSPAKAAIARRAAKEIRKDSYVNLGIGLPTELPRYVPDGVHFELHSENGLLGVGRFPRPGQEDPETINAGKQTVTRAPGASVFSSSHSFAIIRGHHLSMTVLGAMQVSAGGDLANWLVPGKKLTGMGGAMDLVSVKGMRVMVVTLHNAKDGSPKIVDSCSLPLTGAACVDMVVTELGVFTISKEEGMVLREISAQTTLDEVEARTGASYTVAGDLRCMETGDLL